MTHAVFDLVLDVRSPYLFAAIEQLAPGLDATALRDSQGRALIPGDHMRGHLRHAVAALKGPAEGDRLFGSPSVDRGLSGEQDKPVRGLVLVSDLVARMLPGPGADSCMARQASLSYRVAIDEVTGAADEGMLKVVELAAHLGAVTRFIGRLDFANGASDSDVTLLQEALTLLSFVGQTKSAGFGQVISARLDPRPSATKTPPTIAAGTRLKVRVAFDRPLLVDTTRDSFNSFSSSTIVPGGAIKGALARALGSFDGALFARLAVSHAFPFASDKTHLADRAVPDALAIANTDSGRSARLVLSPADMDGWKFTSTPAFPMDWKAEWGIARAALKRPDSGLARQARGRVAIDPNGVAEEGQLFTVTQVETHSRLWEFTIDTAGVDQALTNRIVRFLVDGLPGIGRTGAVAMAAPEDISVVPVPDVPSVSGRVRLVLETPQVMTDPALATPVLDQYRAYFETILGRSVSGFAAMARREMRGDYQAYRFRPRGPDIYEPFELTMPGAVFAFEATAADDLATLARRGLPPMIGSAISSVPAAWERTPFTCENGYGAITIDDGWLDHAAAEIGGGA